MARECNPRRSQRSMCSHTSVTGLASLRGPKANILINSDGHAVLADFGLVTLISDQSTFVTTCLTGGTYQWMSPELLDPKMIGLEKSHPTKESDCYALGMVIYEILSGCTPFGQNISFADLCRIPAGNRPERPQGEAGRLFTDGIWDLLQLCWKAEPRERANAKDILLVLEADIEGESNSTTNNFCMFSRAHSEISAIPVL